MLRRRTTIDPEQTRMRLDEVEGAVRREAESAEADPFDEAMMAAVLGAAAAMVPDSGALSELDARLRKLARQP